MDNEALNLIIFSSVFLFVFLALLIVLSIKFKPTRKYNKNLKRNCKRKDKSFDFERYKLNKQRSDLSYFITFFSIGTFFSIVLLSFGLIRLFMI